MKTGVVLAVIVGLTAGCGQPPETPATAVVPSPAAAHGPVDLYGTSVIQGRVLFNGPAPTAVVIRTDADPYCKSAHAATMTSQDVLVNSNGTLRNVFVYVRQGIDGSYTPPREPALIDQQGCLYHPRVQGVLAGQTVLIRNSDDTLHNIHALCDVNPPFNLGQPARGMESKKVFALPEVMVHFKCDVHPWMSGYLGVLPHPFFAVTGDDGAFTLAKLPPGSYVIEAWHEKLGRRSQSVTVGRDETNTLEFAFSNQP